MHTLQTGIFDRFYHEVGATAGEALGALGNCEARLLHRGPVSILVKAAQGYRQASLTVAKYPVKPDDVWSVSPRNGPALEVIGGLEMNGPLIGGFFWGKAAADWHDFNLDVGGNRNAWLSYVDVEVVQDAIGTACPVVRTVRVYLPRNGTSDPNVRTGEVIPFMVDRSGTAYCTGDVLDGKINDIRDLGGDEDPTDYATGLRGWYIADGANGTDNLSGANVGLGWTGSGDFTTVGASVSSDMSGGTISGDGTTVALTISAHAVSGSPTSITTTESGAHSHNISQSEVESNITLTGSGTYFTDFCIFSIDDAAGANSAFDGTEADANFLNDEGTPSYVTTQGHRHGINVSDLADSHLGFSCNIAGIDTGSVTDHDHALTDAQIVSVIASHSGTVAVNDIAAKLSLSGAAGTHGQGTVIVRIQRVN